MSGTRDAAEQQVRVELTSDDRAIQRERGDHFGVDLADGSDLRAVDHDSCGTHRMKPGSRRRDEAPVGETQLLGEGLDDCDKIVDGHRPVWFVRGPNDVGGAHGGEMEPFDRQRRAGDGWREDVTDFEE